MKHTNLVCTILALSLIALSSCKKENVEALSATSSNESLALQADATAGVVYTMDNAVSGNKVLVYKRAADGSLSYSAAFPTGGKGTGAGLGSQGALIANDHLLFVCNAGSNDVTVFSINGLSLTWIDKISSHGKTPISLTSHNNLLYV